MISNPFRRHDAAPDGRAMFAVFGAGGFTVQMLPTLEKMAAGGINIRILDDRVTGQVGDFPIVASGTVPANCPTVIAVSDGAVRARIAARLGPRPIGSLTAATAQVSRHAAIAPGAIVAEFCVIEPMVRIGRHFHANIFSYVAHECVIGDFVTLAPRVSCNGNVRIGDHVYIGTGASIRQGAQDRPLIIGAGANIGMGSIITRDVPPGTRVRAQGAY